MNNALICVRYVIVPAVILIAAIELLFSDIRIFIGAMVLATAYLAIRYLRTRRRFHRLGYRVFHHGRDSIRYEERCDGEVRSIEFGGEMEIGAPYVVWLPPASTWPQTVPEWARDRRDEIVQRVQHELGPKKYIYE